MEKEKANDKEVNNKESEIRKFVKDNRKMEVTDDLKIETIEKKKLNMFTPVKWIAGIYIIGILGTLLEILLVNVKEYIYSLMMATPFFSVELSALGNILRAPFIMIVLIIPFVLPGIALLFLSKFLIEKYGLFTRRQGIAYLTLLGSMLALITILTYI